MRKFREECSFSDMEIDFLEMKVGAAITWNVKKEMAPKTIDFSHHVTACIAEGLKTLSERNQLSEEALSLYERFVKD